MVWGQLIAGLAGNLIARYLNWRWGFSHRVRYSNYPWVEVAIAPQNAIFITVLRVHSFTIRRDYNSTVKLLSIYRWSWPMSGKPQAAADSTPLVEFAPLPTRKPLVLLRDTERSLRLKTLAVVAPWLPEAVALNVGEASIVADETLASLAEIDLDTIDEAELRSPRFQVGLLFVAFGALAMAFLLLVLYVGHPELTIMEQIRHYWYPYVACVALGIAGLFMVGREAMRPVVLPADPEDETDG